MVLLGHPLSDADQSQHRYGFVRLRLQCQGANVYVTIGLRLLTRPLGLSSQDSLSTLPDPSRQASVLVSSQLWHR